MSKIFLLISKLCLFLSVFPLLFIECNKICFGYDKYSIMYLYQINGTGGDDDVAFKLLTIVTFFFALFLSLVRNKIGYAFLFSVYFICQYLTFLFVESSTVWNMIWSSIIYCDNKHLLIWMVLQILFVINSLLFLHSKRLKP